jgi:hypothetical protein
MIRTIYKISDTIETKRCQCGRMFKPSIVTRSVITQWGNELCAECVDKKLDVSLKNIMNILAESK